MANMNKSKRYQRELSYIIILSLFATLLLALVVPSGEANGLNLSSIPLEILANNSKTESILVKFKSGVSKEQGEGINRALGGESRGFIEELGIELLEPADGISSKELLRRYSTSKSVEFAEPNRLNGAVMNPNDPRFNEQWNLELIGAPLAWETSKGASVVVAVIDTGIDLNHPDLSANIWHNLDEIPANGRDDDNNGFIDDFDGWNFIDSNNDVQDDDPGGHGSHVAGIIAAVSDNALGISSLAHNSQIMIIKALNRRGYGDDFTVAKAITYAVDNGADVINISFGGSEPSQALLKAVEYARRKDCILVAAAGNDGQGEVIYPAALPYVVAVSATDHLDNFASYSNYGQGVDLAAPGGDLRQSILSTTTSSNFGYGIGTSLSSPHVAALAAIIRSARPNLSAKDIEWVMESSAVDLGTPGWDEYYGFGRIDAAKALFIPTIISDPYEPNDTFVTAYPISFGRYKAKITKYGDDLDVFSFNVSSSPKQISIILSNIAEESGYEIRLYDPFRNQLAVSQSDGLKQRIDYALGSAGTYYISLKATRGRGSDDKNYLLELMAEGQSFDFSDLSYFHWSFEDVSYLTSLAIISGYPDGSFKPEDPVSRAEFASIICRAKGWDGINPTRPSFSDVSSDHWAYQSIETAKYHGVISGYQDGSFKPNANATRAEISQMLVSLVPSTTNISRYNFLDVPASYWAYSPILICRANGLISGYPDGRFQPEAKASRSEVSAMLARFLSR